MSYSFDSFQSDAEDILSERSITISIPEVILTIIDFIRKWQYILDEICKCEGKTIITWHRINVSQRNVIFSQE